MNILLFSTIINKIKRGWGWGCIFIYLDIDVSKHL